MAQLRNYLASTPLLLMICLSFSMMSFVACETEYEKIDSYLMEQLPDSEDIKANLAKANELLQAEAKVSPNSRFVRYLRMFTSLEPLLNIEDQSVECNLKTHIAKYDNDLATLGRIHTRPIDVETDNRVERIVYAITWKHSQKCMDIYPADYSKLAADLDQTLVRRVEAITDRLVNKHLFLDQSTKFSQPKAEEVYSQGVSMHTLVSRTFVAAALDGFKAVASEEDVAEVLQLKSTKIEAIRDAVEPMFQEYFVKPCRYMNDKLGMLFEMNDFDSETLKWSDYLNYIHKYKDFYAARGRVSVCMHILEEEQTLKEDIARYLVDSQLEGLPISK